MSEHGSWEPEKSVLQLDYLKAYLAYRGLPLVS